MRIAIVNDVVLIGEALRRMIVQTSEHQVIWVARDGEQAVQFCSQNRPDLILMDLLMPGIDGVETTRRIMQEAPCAILLVTASPEDNTGLVFRALGAGALDVTATPIITGKPGMDSALLAKIRTIGKLIAADKPSSARTASPGKVTSETGTEPRTLVTIGSSTGGPVALARILGAWTPPEDCTVVIVQHIDENFTDSFAKWLGQQIKRPITVIEDHMRLERDRIYMAKTNDHLVFDGDRKFSYSANPRDYPYRPSVDVFFRCVALHWHGNAIGILLTGMGRDGAQGLLAMRHAAMLTITQDQASSAVYGMPRAAAEIGAAELVLPLERIAGELGQRVGGRGG
ncbi:chemotaxis-specific protein-glutamate methyltransferase CheB [Noviherbaspirillum aerium]|uniref:chemotaxis-specific protein-glutamate methyltransferase CheB n=1 Tax=Noviherbaspirillum aerium TaxID=2588497 RepID=UPI00124EF007|nr:chemotaxis-specific protein-glutamate methyltransferase CheB [Noviherbaspirillum aerium]